MTLVLLLLGGFASMVYADVAEQSARLDPDKLRLGSVAAMVLDGSTGKTLYSKRADTVMPIASITKVMTAMVVLDSDQPLDEFLEVKKPDLNTRKNAWSRIRPGSKARRDELLRIALMSSENVAAWLLGHHYPGGMTSFVAAMNDKAHELGMINTSFADTTGLLVENRSTASDLGRMVVAASTYEKIREYTTTRHFQVKFRNPGYTLDFVNTNPLVRRGSWDINLSKTGFLTEAGRCLVMLTEVDDREVVMILLDSYGTKTPMGDAGRIRRWIETGESGYIAEAALRYAREKGAGYQSTESD